MFRQRCFLSMLHRTCEKLNEGVGLAEFYGDVRLVRWGRGVDWLD